MSANNYCKQREIKSTKITKRILSSFPQVSFSFCGRGFWGYEMHRDQTLSSRGSSYRLARSDKSLSCSSDQWWRCSARSLVSAHAEAQTWPHTGADTRGMQGMHPPLDLKSSGDSRIQKVGGSTARPRKKKGGNINV